MAPLNSGIANPLGEIRTPPPPPPLFLTPLPSFLIPSPPGKGLRWAGPRWGKGSGRWHRRKKAREDAPFPGRLQPWRRRHRANDQLGTLGEMGPSFSDKHFFYQPIKIPLSLICWLLLQLLGTDGRGTWEGWPGVGAPGAGREEADQAPRLGKPHICCGVLFPPNSSPFRRSCVLYARTGARSSGVR